VPVIFDMQVIFTKTNHVSHTLTLIRDDGSREVASGLETRSYLRHDLMHYVVEKEAGLAGSFYGAIEKGKGFDETRPGERIDAMNREMAIVGEGGLTEMVVATLQGAHREDFDAGAIMSGLPEYLKVQGFDMPPYLTRSFIEKVAKEFRFLLRRYESMPTGQAMALEF
jgi:hypothetical protein